MNDIECRYFWEEPMTKKQEAITIIDSYISAFKKGIPLTEVFKPKDSEYPYPGTPPVTSRMY